jgi:hypothetical protein
VSVPEWFLFLYFKYWYFRSLQRFWDCDFNFVNVLELHQSRDDKWYNKRVLIWRFTLVLIKINYGQIGDQTALYTTNPVFYTSANRFVRQTDTFGNLIFFHLSRRTTVIQDLLRQFSLVPDNGTNFNVEACSCIIKLSCLDIPEKFANSHGKMFILSLILKYILYMKAEVCKSPFHLKVSYF